MSKIYIYILLPICLCITHISYAQTTSDDSTKNKRTYLKMGHEFYQTNGNFMLNGRFNSTWIELSPLICKVPITLIFQYSTFFDHSNTSHKYRFSFKYNKQTNLPNYDTSNLLNDSIIELNKKLAINKNIFEKNFNQHFLKTFHVPEMKSSVLAVDTFNMSSSFQLPYDSACIYINNYANQLEKYKTEYDALSTINDSLSPLNSNNSADYKKRKIELNKLDIGQNTLSESPLTLYDIQYSGILTEIDYNNFILQVAGGNLYDNKNLYSLNFFNTSHDSLSFFKFSSGYDFEKNKVKIGGIFYYNGINLKNLSHKTSIISFQNQTNLNKNNQLKITVASSIASTNNISENSYNLYDAGAISITTSHFIPKSSTSINISFQTLGKTYNNPGNKFLLPGDKCKKINITQPLTKSKKVSIHSEISSNSNKDKNYKFSNLSFLIEPMVIHNNHLILLSYSNIISKIQYFLHDQPSQEVKQKTISLNFSSRFKYKSKFINNNFYSYFTTNQSNSTNRDYSEYLFSDLISTTLNDKQTLNYQLSFRKINSQLHLFSHYLAFYQKIKSLALGLGVGDEYKYLSKNHTISLSPQLGWVTNKFKSKINFNISYKILLVNNYDRMIKNSETLNTKLTASF